MKVFTFRIYDQKNQCSFMQEIKASGLEAAKKSIRERFLSWSYFEIKQAYDSDGNIYPYEVTFARREKKERAL